MTRSVNRYLLAAAVIAAIGAASEKAGIVVQAADSPVRLDRATVVTVADAPPLIVYSATNTTAETLDQFTVIAMVFDAQGTLKARQTAPGRRTLEPHETKFSTLVLDGAPFDATDQIVIGVNQAQKAGSDVWWRAELRDAAAAAIRPPSKR